LRDDTDSTRRPVRSLRTRITASAAAADPAMLAPLRSRALRNSTANGLSRSGAVT